MDIIFGLPPEMKRDLLFSAILFALAAVIAPRKRKGGSKGKPRRSANA
jgi:hypothetical protein